MPGIPRMPSLPTVTPAMLTSFLGSLAGLAQNVGVLAQNMGPKVGHLPVIAPADIVEGVYNVFCHQCSVEAQDYITPCKLEADDATKAPLGVWPVNPQLYTVAAPSLVNEGRIEEAIKAMRGRWMDIPSDSVEAVQLTSFIEVLIGS